MGLNRLCWVQMGNTGFRRVLLDGNGFKWVDAGFFLVTLG